MSTALRDEPRAKRPADVHRLRKHEAARRCALGAGGLRPFAALGLVIACRVSSRVARHRASRVIACRSSSRVARHRASRVIARRVSSRVACHRASRVISACMQPAPLNVDCAPRRAASEATGRCSSAAEARGFAPVCTRRRWPASLRCARARHRASRVIARRSSSRVACHQCVHATGAAECRLPPETSRERSDRQMFTGCGSTRLRAGVHSAPVDCVPSLRSGSSSRVARHRASRVIAHRVSSRVARHRASRVIARRVSSMRACNQRR